MRKRILFNDLDVVTKVINEGESEGNDSVVDNNHVENLLDAVGFNLRFSGDVLSGYEPARSSTVVDASGITHPAMGGWPSGEVSFTVPPEDEARVNGWITGDYHGASPESEKLTKNYQSAVNDLLAGYFTTALNHNIFTSPCRFAWCAVYDNGERGRLREISIKYPNLESPILPISSMVLRDGRFYSNVDIRNVPSALEYYVALPEGMRLESLGVSKIEVYATAQVQMRDPKSDVYGIRSVNVDDELRRCWVYDRYSADEIGISCADDSVFRQISSMESENLNLFEINSNLFEENSNWQEVPIPSGKLAYFSQSKIYKAGFDASSSGGSDEESSDAVKRVYLESGYFCLGDPERDKHIRRVSLYGIFPRLQEDIRFIIYGSHHREHWHKIAESGTPDIVGLRATSYRWFKISVETLLRPGDFLEAVMVEYD